MNPAAHYILLGLYGEAEQHLRQALATEHRWGGPENGRPDADYRP